MPSINKDFLLQLGDDYRLYNTFIETGTLCGDTTFAMEPFFDKLHTIEFSEKYYSQTKGRYTGDKINFLLGDSSVVFTSLLPTINDTAIFFLDGHYSSGDTGQSAKDCPLVEEVSLINTLFKGGAIIIVDDVRLFGNGPKNGYSEDWTQISVDGLTQILNDRIQKVYFLDSSYAKNDRLIIHINPIN